MRAFALAFGLSLIFSVAVAQETPVSTASLFDASKLSEYCVSNQGEKAKTACSKTISTGWNYRRASAFALDGIAGQAILYFAEGDGVSLATPNTLDLNTATLLGLMQSAAA
jgi:hypothetical protein